MNNKTYELLRFLIQNRNHSFTLKELLLEKPLSKITVNDITERCDINRQTFYYHFESITDLVEWTCLEDADKVLKDKATYKTWQDAFLAIFDLMKKDRPFIMNIYHSVSLEVLLTYLYKIVYPIIYKVVDEKSKGYIINEENKKFITDFYKYSFVAIVLKWIKEDMKEDPKTIIHKISLMTNGTIENALNNLKTGNKL